VGFRFANVAGRAALVDDAGNWHDAERASGGGVPADPMQAVGHGPALHEAAARLDPTAADGSVATATVLAPVPTASKVFGIGLNYRAHVEESGVDVPEQPVVFTKFPSCVVGPTDDVVLNCTAGDYEGELVVVIGAGGRDIAEQDAWRHVFGLTIGQDISDRALQFAAKPAHFDLGKSRDTFGPTGPVVVSPDLFDDPGDLQLTCDVNGVQRQSTRTSDLIFGIPFLVAYLSAIMRLSPGDLIFTGTPSGVGAARGEFLEPGDVITTTVDGIGTMTNRCVA